MEREELELANLRADRLKIEAERTRIELESDEIRRRLLEKWYARKTLLQAIIGGIVASALLAAWLVGYFQPILRKQQEIDGLENKRLAAELSFREQELKQEQTESKRIKEALAIEGERAKTELESLLSQNRQLQEAQKSTEDLAASLRSALDNTQRRLANLSSERVIPNLERERLEAAARIARERADALSAELQKLQLARTETQSRSSQLSEQLRTRDIAGNRVLIIYTEKNSQTAAEASKLLTDLGATVTLTLTSDRGNAEHTGKLYYNMSSKLVAAKQIAELVGKLQKVVPQETKTKLEADLNLWVTQ